MNCWHCNTELVWNCDYDIEEDYPDYCMMTYLHCPKCESDVEVYLPKEKKEETDE